MKGSAEDEYRNAFKRIVDGKTIRIPKGSPPTLANIAREAGRDPSALKKSRYPIFITEVEEYNSASSLTMDQAERSLTAQLAAARAENKSLREKCSNLCKERDAAQTKILNLQQALVAMNLQLEGEGGLSNIAVMDQHAREKLKKNIGRDKWS